MIVRDGVKPLVFREDGRTVEVRYDNRGEPYRDGVELVFDNDDRNSAPVWVLLEEHEVVQLRDKLNEYLGQVAAKLSPKPELCEFTGLHITEENPNAEVCKCGKPSLFNEVTQLYVGCCQDCIPF